MAEGAVDVALAALIVALGWRCLAGRSTFAACVAFVAFGLAMALGWARLGAPDVALAEAALGAGITGALLIDAARAMGERGEGGDGDG